jgi:diaminopimelate decarboxylase
MIVASEAGPGMIDELQACTRATLAFDLARLASNMRRIAAAARTAGIRPLFAVKSFPHPRAIALAAEHLDGFDVASPAELVTVPKHAIISVADPTGAAIAGARGARVGARVIVACETVDQVRAAPPGAEIAIRISASISGLDPAIGAVLDGSGHRRSRFGLHDREAVAALARAASGRRVGLHVHHGPVVATSADRFVATVRAAMQLADFEPAFIDLGGAWHGIADLAAAFVTIRAAVPSTIELLAEPGRAYASGAGFACGIVQAARSLGDRELVVVDLSRACHLRWSTFELVAKAPHPGAGRRVLVVGPTCYEEDVLGEWTVDPAAIAQRVIVEGISGYALAWNTGFGGVPPADVIVREA